MTPFLIAAAALAVTPGPGLAYVVARTAAGGLSEGLASCLGTGIGGMFHVLAAALGLSLVVAESAAAFTVIKYLGAGFLIFLGIRLLLRREMDTAGRPVAAQGARRALLEGVLVEALNVKTALFFLAFLPQFADPGRPLVPQLALLGGICVGFNTLVDVAAVFGAARLLQSGPVRGARARLLTRASGVTMLGLGVFFWLSPGAESDAVVGSVPAIPEIRIICNQKHMYTPPHFEEKDPAKLERLIRDYPLGTLVHHSPQGLDATHLPFIHRPGAGTHGTLIAHVARKNPIWGQVSDGDGVLVIFRGPDAYISPNWYPSKHETHRHVPTWNYQVVHVHGKIRFIDDPRFLRGAVALLTNIQEAAAGEAKPWKLSDGEKDYIAGEIAMIVGVEIGITAMEGKFKLSQNRDERDKNGVIEKLRCRGEAAAADAVAEASHA